jgi:hypothetical protein
VENVLAKVKAVDAVIQPAYPLAALRHAVPRRACAQPDGPTYPEIVGMAINLNCECGKKLAVKDEMAGKKVKCPGCGSVLTVPAAMDDADQVSEPAVPRASDTAKPKKSSKTLWIVGGVGVLLLSCCCLGSVVTAFVVVFAMGGPEKTIVGKWTPDLDMAKKSTDKRDPQSQAANMAIEFKSDGVVLDGTPMSPILMGKWKTVSTKDSKNLTVELSASNATKRLDIKIVDNNHLVITPEGMKEFYFKRVP